MTSTGQLIETCTYARFDLDDRTTVWHLLTDGVRELCGGLFDTLEPNGREFAFNEVKLLAPCVPPKILAGGPEL